MVSVARSSAGRAQLRGVVVGARGAARFLDLFGHGLRRSLGRGPKYTSEPAMAAAELGSLSRAAVAAVMARERAGV